VLGGGQCRRPGQTQVSRACLQFLFFLGPCVQIGLDSCPLCMFSLTLIQVWLIKNSDQAREVACVRSAVHEKRHGGRGVAWAYGVGGVG
jgi:hypothetical protein